MNNIPIRGRHDCGVPCFPWDLDGNMKIIVCELDTHVRHVLVGQYAGRISVGDDSDRWFVWQIFDANGIAAVAAGVADALAK